MVATRLRFVRILLIALACAFVLPTPMFAVSLEDRPIIWHDDDRGPIPSPAERDPSIFWDYFDDSVFLPFGRMTDPNRLLRRAVLPLGADHVGPAHNVNRLDEVPNSSWFTNRIGLFPITPLQASRGPGHGKGPDRGGAWTVISAKTKGVTPGFVVRDRMGDVYLIKFDPPGFLGMTTCAGVISGRILHAAGYNVPDDAVVTFRREDLRLGEGVKIKEDGVKRTMTVADLDAILDMVERLPDGSIHAISSKYVDGRPIGPFDYLGRRKDDPNDLIPHQKRRELRGLRIFAAWLNHFDTKQQNSLDTFIKLDGGTDGETDGDLGYVRHYLIDFASTLGSGASGPSVRYGREYTADYGAILKRALTLGLCEDPWRSVERPEGLGEIGYLDGESFAPLKFDPLQPNSAFADLTDRDGYWAAKIVSAFTDEHLLAICEEAGYRDPEAAPFVARMLGVRRDIIAREFFGRVAPLDFFHWNGKSLEFRDLGIERGIYNEKSSYHRVRVASVDGSGKAGARSDWQKLTGLRVTPGESSVFREGLSPDASEQPFLEFECQVHRDGGWSDSVFVYVARASGRVIRVER